MKTNFWFVFLYQFVTNYVKGDLNGNCYVPGVKPEDWSTYYKNAYKVDAERFLFKVIGHENITNVKLRNLDDKKYFFISKFYWSLQPSKLFESYEINERSTSNPEIHVTLDFKCHQGNGTLNFRQPIKDINTYKPEFSKNIYTYTVPSFLPANINLYYFGEPIVACDYDITNMNFIWNVEPADTFEVIESNPTDENLKCHTPMLVTKNFIRFTEDSTYNISATDSGMPPMTGSACIKILADKETTIVPNPYFEQPYYLGDYILETEDYHYLKFEHSICLRDGTDKITVKFVGTLFNYLNYFFKENCIIVVLKHNFPDYVLKAERVTVITLEAKLENAHEPAKTVLIVYFPKVDIPGTTCPPSNTREDCPIYTNVSTTVIECPSCPPCETESTTSSAQECIECPKIYFEKDNYYFDVSSQHVGFVSYVTAVSQHQLKYRIEEIDDESFQNSIIIEDDTGRLETLELLEIKTYRFWVYAECVKLSLRTKTMVIIDVLNNLENDYFLYVEYVKEKESKNINITCQRFKTCHYSIISQYPETSPKLFYFRPDGLLHATSINREMDELLNMSVPQFTLTIEMTDKDTSSKRYSTNSKKDLSNFVQFSDQIEREWVYLPTKLSYHADRLVLSIIIKDVNDNPPVFSVGQNGTLVVGYPKSHNLIEYISPAYLTKVVATDKDSGINGDIRFNTTGQYFIVDSTTGVVYPTKKAFENVENLRFTVWATDMGGAENGLSEKLDVEVKLLSTDNLATLKIYNFEDVERLLVNLSIETNYTFNYLSINVIPDVKWSVQKNTNTTLEIVRKIVLYGFDYQNRVLTTNEIIRVFSNVQVWPAKCTIENFILLSSKTVFSESKVIVIYVIAISALSVFTVVLVMYVVVFCVSPRQKKRKGKKKVELERIEEYTVSRSLEKQSSRITVNNEKNGEIKRVIEKATINFRQSNKPVKSMYLDDVHILY